MDLEIQNIQDNQILLTIDQNGQLIHIYIEVINNIKKITRNIKKIQKDINKEKRKKEELQKDLKFLKDFKKVIKINYKKNQLEQMVLKDLDNKEIFSKKVKVFQEKGIIRIIKIERINQMHVNTVIEYNITLIIFIISKKVKEQKQNEEKLGFSKF